MIDVFCKDCAHHKDSWGYHLCSHPSAATRDYVSGKAFADIERFDFRGCGHFGKFFTPRPPQMERFRSLVSRLLGLTDDKP